MSNEYFLQQHLNEIEQEMVSIPKKEYDELVNDSVTLSKLYAGGVDNWEWYEESLSKDDD